MKIIHNIKESYKHIPYTLKHKVWVSKIGWKVYHKRYFLHDMDKVLLYIFCPFLGVGKISQIHQVHAHHHLNRGLSDEWLHEAFVDWESARFSKGDKPLNARQTLYTWFYGLISKHVLNMMDEFEKRL